MRENQHLTVREMSAENDIRKRAFQEIVEFRRNGNFVPATFLLPDGKTRASTKKYFLNFVGSLNSGSQRLSSQQYDGWFYTFSSLWYE
jgi:hypothetical protein